MTQVHDTEAFDYILIGGGLQNGLIALALKHYQPDASVLLIERDRVIAGNHTWSFHPGDVPECSRRWIDGIIQYRWPEYQVRVDDLRRTVGLEYASVASNHFADVVSGLFGVAESETVADFAAVGSSASGATVMDLAKDPRTSGSLARSTTSCRWELMTDTEVVHVSENEVRTACGKRLRGQLVIDSRGPATVGQRNVFSGCGYQKFFGFEIELKQDGPFAEPVIMDAVEEQGDGFRFVYTLPFTPRRILVEDTRFSDSPAIERGDCLDQVTRYLRAHGVADFEIVREESGVLPMPFSSELRPAATMPLSGGYAGGWFHAATGYSFPMAVAFAETIAAVPQERARQAVHELSQSHQWRSIYGRFLNRLLFRLVTPRKRFRIFRRFYRVLSDPSIERFYSHQFTFVDALRIVVGVPPTIMGLRPLKFVRSFLRGDLA